MAKKKRYIAQYRMPVGIDNPPVNIPYANTPEDLNLTDAEAEKLKQMIPDIKLVKAENSKDSAEAVMAAAEQEEPEEGNLETEGDITVDTKSEDDEEEEEEKSSEDTEDQDNESEDKSEPEDEEDSEEDDSDAEEKTEHLLEDDPDFPGEDKLREHGFNTVEEVIEFKKEKDLTDISGIGSATADKITDHVMENYADLIG